jgi:hypothetical protein
VLLRQKEAKELKTNKKTRKPSKKKIKSKRSNKQTVEDDDSLLNFVLCRDESDDDDEDWAENIRPKTPLKLDIKLPCGKIF